MVCDPMGIPRWKRKKSKVLRPAFYLCRVGQVWVRFVLVCLGFGHCEHPVCVSGDALLSQGWMAPPGTGRAAGGTGSVEGLGDFIPVKPSEIELDFLLMEMAEGGARGKLSINFWSFFCTSG